MCCQTLFQKFYKNCHLSTVLFIFYFPFFFFLQFLFSILVLSSGINVVNVGSIVNVIDDRVICVCRIQRGAFASDVQTQCGVYVYVFASKPRKANLSSEKCRYEPCGTRLYINQDVECIRYTIPYHREFRWIHNYVYVQGFVNRSVRSLSEKREIQCDRVISGWHADTLILITTYPMA